MSDERNHTSTNGTRRRRWAACGVLGVALLLLATALDAAPQGQGKKGKKRDRSGQGASQQQGSPPPAESPQPPRDPQLRPVEGKLLAYATKEARSQLERVYEESREDHRIAMARVLEQEKAYDAAARELRQAAEMAPGDPAPWLALGQTYLHAGREGDARNAYDEARRRAQPWVDATPDSAEARLALGQALSGLKQYDAADPHLAKAHDLAPSDPLPLYERGAMRVAQQRWQEAVDLLNQALSRDAAIAYAYYYRGVAYGKLGRKDLMVSDFDRFVRAAPDAPEAAAAKSLLAAMG